MIVLTVINKVNDFRPGSDAVLHMSRIEFNEYKSSCEVRRLNRASEYREIGR